MRRIVWILYGPLSLVVLLAFVEALELWLRWHELASGAIFALLWLLGPLGGVLIAPVAFFGAFEGWDGPYGRRWRSPAASWSSASSRWPSAASSASSAPPPAPSARGSRAPGRLTDGVRTRQFEPKPRPISSMARVRSSVSSARQVMPRTGWSVPP